MVQEGKCDADISALVLLKEMSRGSEEIGSLTMRETLSLMRARQEEAQAGKKTYCSCSALRFVAEFLEQGKDKIVPQRASELLQVASGPGGPCVVNVPEKQQIAADTRAFTSG